MNIVKIRTFIPCDLDKPGFKKDDGRIHNWKNYIDSDVKKHWKKLPLILRIHMVLKAEEEAQEEEWD